MVNPKSVIKDFLLLKFLEFLKIEELNEIQAEAIQKGLFFHQNFLVCTPSGSGKTLIGLLGIANAILQGQKCVYLVPYKALAAEKQEQFQNVFKEMAAILKQKIYVHVLTGDSEQELKDVQNFDVLITTYEKCDSLMRQPESLILHVKTIVADEIHEIASDNRGGRIEMLITRILVGLPFVQFIALSATIENINDFRLWLSSLSADFRLIFSTYRPVPLEYSLIVAENKLAEIKKLVTETVAKHGQVLIFVNRRKDCADYANLLKNVVKRYMAIEDTNKCLKGKEFLILHKSVADSLKDTLEYGVGYHNASLSSIERQAVEGLYRERALKVLIATTTLAAGINTPARLVIVENIVQTGKYIDLEDSDFKKDSFQLSLGVQGVFKPHSPNLLFQMLGRAGRPGYDSIGKGVILVKNENELRFARYFYFCQDLDANQTLIPKYADLNSRLNNLGVLEEVILVKINEEGGASLAEIQNYLEHSLFYYLVKKKLFATENRFIPEQDLIKYLFIDKMDLGYFLQVHGSQILSGFTHSLTEVATTFIKGYLIYNNAYFHYVFDATRGVYCSCNPTKYYRATSVNDNYCFDKLCPHITTVIHDFYCGNLEPYRNTLEFLLPVIFQHEYVLDQLIDNGMIFQQPHSTTFKITPFGRLALTLYLLPSEMMWVFKRLSLFSFEDPNKFLDVILQFHILNSKKERSKLEHLATCWIEEYSVESILQDLPGFGVGDLFSIKNELTRIASIFEAVARFMGKNGIAVQFARLSLRLKHGVMAELVDILEAFPAISRNKARIIFNSGYKTRALLEAADAFEIHTKTQIPLIKVKEALGQYEKPRFMATSLLSFISENTE